MSIFMALKCVAKLLAKRVVPNASWLLKVRLILIQDQHMCYIKLTTYQLVRNKTYHFLIHRIMNSAILWMGQAITNLSSVHFGLNSKVDPFWKLHFRKAVAWCPEKIISVLLSASVHIVGGPSLYLYICIVSSISFCNCHL